MMCGRSCHSRIDFLDYNKNRIYNNNKSILQFMQHLMVTMLLLHFSCTNYQYSVWFLYVLFVKSQRIRKSLSNYKYYKIQLIIIPYPRQASALPSPFLSQAPHLLTSQLSYVSISKTDFSHFSFCF